MEPTILEQLRKSWIEKENAELMSKQRPKRRYFHFDPVIQSISHKIVNNIFNIEYIKCHSFLPLLHRDKKSRLYKKNPATGKKQVTLKLRPISYASHFDALIYSWYGFILEFYYERLIKDKIINESVIAYRSLNKKSNIDFAKEVFEFVIKKGDCVTISLDIKGFYDNIDHKILKQKWCFLLTEKELPEDCYKVFRSITKYAYVDLEALKREMFNEQIVASKFFSSIDILKTLRKKGQVFKYAKEFGIPQGTPISCVLSNLYMYDFDSVIAEKIKNISGLYRRYSDDIVIICDKDNEKEMMDFVGAEIKKIKLVIQDNKTEIRYFSFRDGFLACVNKSNKLSRMQYLGLEFDGQKTYIRHKGYAKFERNMTYAIRQEKKKALKYNKPFNKRSIYSRFSHFGKTTFITYVKKAGSIFNSSAIINQIKPSRIYKKIKNKIKNN